MTASQHRGYDGGRDTRRVRTTVSTSNPSSFSGRDSEASPAPADAAAAEKAEKIEKTAKSEKTEKTSTGTAPARRRRKVTAAATAPAQVPAAEQPVLTEDSRDPRRDPDGEARTQGIQETQEAHSGGADADRVAEAADAAESSDLEATEATDVAEDSEVAEVAEEIEASEAENAEADDGSENSQAGAERGDEAGAPGWAPYLPAASLLFQAPDPARARRRRRKVTAATTAPAQAPAAEQPALTAAQDDEGDSEARASGEPATASKGGRRRRRKATAAQAAPEHLEAPADDSDDSDDMNDSGNVGESENRGDADGDSRDDERDGAGRRKRRRGGRGRRTRSRNETRQGGEKEDGKEDKGKGKEDSDSDSADPRSSRADAEETADAAEEASSSRRRRRRSRSRTRSDAGRDPRDEVTALKGSTRLEAKRQRRREGRAAGRRRPIVTEAEFLARRESVDRQMIVRESDGLNQIAVLEDGLLVEHYVSRHTQTSMVGNVYVGRVQNVLPSMEAAFVDLGKGRNAVLYAGEVNWDAAGMEGRPRRIEDALSSGDTVLVQVTKDPIGHKGARLTSQITLAGRYLVLVPGGTMTGISRKLPDTERSRLKKILKRIVPDSAGVIVRTAAEGASQEQLTSDVERLVAQWEAIEKKASSVMKGSGKAPVLLKGEPELAVRVIRDVFNEDFRKLIVSGDRTWSTISQYIDEVSPDLAERLEHWTGPEEVFAAHRVDEQLAKGFDRKVWLPSGGTLVIDRTEAMTVIDVNTGRFTGAGGTLEETVTRNNLEAAEEIVRQLRLRDIGGMVVIDFVDMVLESNRDLVLRRLVECLGRDRTRHQVTEVTSLGLVQMTRKRVGQGLVEAFSTICEHCKGRGFIVHDEPVENQQVDMSASASRGGGRSRGRKNREEQAAAGKKESKKDSQETKSSKSAKGSGRGKGSAGRDVVGSPESGADDEARAAVRGALAQIAAAAEQAHKEAEQESPEPQEAVGPQGAGEEQAEMARDAVEDGDIQDAQDTQASTGEDGPARSRARKSAEKASERKAAKRTGKKTEKAEKKAGKKTEKKAEKKTGNGPEAPAEQQPGETPEESVGEKPARRTRRRATAKGAAPSSENSSETSDASA